jgi:hypothetical protein
MNYFLEIFINFFYFFEFKFKFEIWHRLLPLGTVAYPAVATVTTVYCAVTIGKKKPWSGPRRSPFPIPLPHAPICTSTRSPTPPRPLPSASIVGGRRGMLARRLFFFVEITTASGTVCQQHGFF